jgi:hypothetical protein
MPKAPPPPEPPPTAPSPGVAAFAKRVEAGAKALAWSKLSDRGRQTCDWLLDFSEAERAEFRATATIVLQAAQNTKGRS